MKQVAIILAAGAGVRSGFVSPKQLVKLAGRPVLAHSIRAFENSKYIDEIAVVTSSEISSEVEALINKCEFKKVKKILIGGSERWESSWSAIRAYEKEAEANDLNLIFHDAVRPLVDELIIERVVTSLQTELAVDVVVKTVDTIIEVDSSEKYINKILDRNKLRNGQTPQGFRYSLIREAYERAIDSNNLKFTDDCGILSQFMPDVKIALVDGTSYNTKLTYNEDLSIIDKLFQLKRHLLMPGHDEDAWRQSASTLKGKVVVVFGGTSGIGESICSVLNEFGAKPYAFSRKTNCDVSNVEDVVNVLENIYRNNGRIDFVVNAAGILTKQPLSCMSHKEILSSININYVGAVNVAYASFEYLRKSQGALLLFTSSSYTYGRANYSVYSSSKAAVVNFVQAIAEEWGEFGIRVNCICPERTLTPMRISAFGNEDPDTLLSVDEVSKTSVKALTLSETGLIIDVKRKV